MSSRPITLTTSATFRDLPIWDVAFTRVKRRKNHCCENADLTVICVDNIQELKIEALEEWLEMSFDLTIKSIN
ncbi:18913_t:CDS:2 [Funneliformis geosporum]|nr:18913_t:CDS:2 [Funneliformis geosporum]